MKYRMQHNEHVEGIRLMRGEKHISARGLSLGAVAYHEAAVEFWQENERLRAVNAELLSACQPIRVIAEAAAKDESEWSVDATSMEYSQLDEPKATYGQWRNFLAAIARAEAARKGGAE